MGSVSAWEAIFMLVVLKIPIVYLGAVVWWAVRAEPHDATGDGDLTGAPVSLGPCNWDDWRRRRRSAVLRRPKPRRGPPQGARVARPERRAG